MTTTFPDEQNAPARKKVRVTPGGSGAGYGGNRAYDILIGEGLLARAGALVAPLLNRQRTTIITDRNVDARHGETLRASLTGAGIDVRTIAVEPGEASKSLNQVNDLCARLSESGIERSDTLIAFGGGVVGDLGGFVAAVLHRGMDFIQIPTTLLAQVDSAVGGKTGVNLPQGKNLVGAFHQPRLVLSDVSLLATLPRREFLAGYAEVVKYAALGDAPMFDWLEERLAAGALRTPAFLTEAVGRSCEAKARIVAQDEREAGVRALLNLGHTFGHGIEACAGYDGRVLHGEAVAVGMGLAFDASAAGTETDADLIRNDGERLRTHLRESGLPALPRDLKVPLAVGDLMAAMGRDKKTSQGRMTLILVRRLGQAYVAKGLDNTLAESVWRQHLDPRAPQA